MIGEMLNKTLALVMNDAPAGKQWLMLKSLIFYAAAPGKNGEMLNKTLILLLIFRVWKWDFWTPRKKRQEQ